MNATSKLTQFREFRANLNAVVTALGATAVHTARMDDGVFNVFLKANPNVNFDITYTNYHYHGAPRLYIDRVGRGQAMLKNLTVANLTKHLGARIDDAKRYVDEMAEDDRIDKLTYKAEKQMAQTLDTQLALDHYGNFTASTNHADYRVWKNAKGWIKLAYVSGKRVDGVDTITYNFDYEFSHGSLTQFKGEFDATELAGVLRAVHALNSL